jgi:hypothetical protein
VKPFEGDNVVGPTVFRRRELPIIVPFERFKPLLLNALPLEDNKRWASFARGGDTLDERRPHSASIAFSSNNLPSFLADDYSVGSLAFGDAPFIHIVAIFGQNLGDGWQAKKIEPRLNYGRRSPIDSAKVHLTASKTSNLGVSHEKSGQPALSEWWWSWLWVGDPSGEVPQL